MSEKVCNIIVVIECFLMFTFTAFELRNFGKEQKKIKFFLEKLLGNQTTELNK